MRRKTRTTHVYLRLLHRIRAAEASARRKPSRKVSISTIIILVLAAIAGIAYYLGTPGSLPSANAACTPPQGAPQIVIPSGVGENASIKYEPPTLTLVVGVNDTVVWSDRDNTTVHNVISVSVPPNGKQWDFEEMTSGNYYCVTLTTPGTYTYEMYLPYIVEGTIIVKTAS